MRLLRDWGAEQKYVHTLRGYNYRMEGMQGAILRVKLRHLEDWTKARIAHAACYDEQLDALGVKRPSSVRAGERHVYHIYAIRVPHRDALRDAMVAAGVGVSMHYPIPLHLQPCYKDLGYKEGDFPVTEAFGAETLSLPLFAEITEAQRSAVCAELERSLAKIHGASYSLLGSRIVAG